MEAKIIKLDEYIEAYQQKHQKVVEEEPVEETWTNETFNGVDIAEGFNYRCQVTNEVARGSIMDWLEENGHDYLIDNEGRFAVKCPDRKTEYSIARQFEHILNRWDRGPVGKAIDPDLVKQGLPQTSPGKALVDNVSEIAGYQPTYTPGTGKSVEPMQTYPMFPSKKKKHEYLDWDDPSMEINEVSYPDSEEGVHQFMATTQHGLSDNIEIIPDPVVGFVWMVIDHGNQSATIVYLKDDDSEEVDYNEAVEKYSRMGMNMESIIEKKKGMPSERELSQMADAGTNPAAVLSHGQYKPKTITDKKKEQSKTLARKKVRADESLLEGSDLKENVVGNLTGMPTIGRIKQLAGIPNGTEIEVTMTGGNVAGCDCGCSDCQCNVGPCNCCSACQCDEESALDLAMQKLQDVFDVYTVLGCDEKEQFRKHLIDCLMRN